MTTESWLAKIPPEHLALIYDFVSGDQRPMQRDNAEEMLAMAQLSRYFADSFEDIRTPAQEVLRAARFARSSLVSAAFFKNAAIAGIAISSGVSIAGNLAGPVLSTQVALAGGAVLSGASGNMSPAQAQILLCAAFISGVGTQYLRLITNREQIETSPLFSGAEFLAIAGAIPIASAILATERVKGNLKAVAKGAIVAGLCGLMAINTEVPANIVGIMAMAGALVAGYAAANEKPVKQKVTKVKIITKA